MIINHEDNGMRPAFNLKSLKLRPFALLTALVLASTLLLACGGDEPSTGLTQEEVREIVRTGAPAQPGLTRAEVEEAVQTAIGSAIADLPEPGISEIQIEAQIQTAIQQAIAAMPDPGVTQADVQELIQAAVSDLLEPQQPLTEAEIRRIAKNTVAPIPAKSDPAEYTKFFVDSAVAMYETEGLDATLAHYNLRGSVDEQWYVFIVDQDGEVVSHYNPQVLGENLNGPLGIDAGGYEFGAEMLEADENGKWISYVYYNPATGNLGSEGFGALQLKNAWVVQRGDLLFGSGWYVNADAFTKQLVETAVASYRLIGLEGTMAAFNSPDSATAGLSEAIAYYNSSHFAQGEWFAVIAEENGRIVAHYDTSLVGGDLADLYGDQTLNASLEGGWVSSGVADSSDGADDLRAYLVKYDGMIFGSGWHRGRSAN